MRVKRSQNWSDFREDRVKRMRFTVQESIDSAAWTAFDLSASTAKVYFRAWTMPSDALTTSDFIVNAVQTKLTTGSDGKFDTRNVFLAGYGEIMCALVLVDEAVGSQPTPSTYREEDLAIWKAHVEESVQP
jgi:hypothetical protein